MEGTCSKFRISASGSEMCNLGFKMLPLLILVHVAPF